MTTQITADKQKNSRSPTVMEIVPLQKGGHQINLIDGQHLPVGRHFKESLYASIKA